jgi:hypothetical protein
MHNIDVKKEDVLIVLRQSGEIELYLPETRPEDPISSATLAAFVAKEALSNADIFNSIVAKLVQGNDLISMPQSLPEG